MYLRMRLGIGPSLKFLYHLVYLKNFENAMVYKILWMFLQESVVARGEGENYEKAFYDLFDSTSFLVG